MLQLRRTAAVLAAAGLTLCCVLAATPAQAQPVLAGKCSDLNEKTFDLPWKPDVWVGIQLCIYRTGAGNGHGWANVAWQGAFMGGKRFNKFNLQVRIERYDTVLESLWCSLTDDLNSQVERNSTAYCSVVKTSSAKNGWSTDGKVEYDIADDGKPVQTWELHGSPRVA